jgi:HK97 gp10 family phage protein
MAQDIYLTLTGDKKFDKQFEKLEKKLRQNAARRGVRKINTVFRKEGRKAAPRGTDRLKKSLKSKVSTKFNVVKGVTGVDAGPGAKHDAWYANFVEYGTKNRSTTYRIFNLWVTGAGGNWLRSDKRMRVAPTDLKSYPKTMFMHKTFNKNWRAAVKLFQNEMTKEVFKSRGASEVVLGAFD